jgi:hypothetical protein
MGLLDDAIREHLDLKRRHGADAQELDRIQHEALGPAVRAPAPSEEAPRPAEEPPEPDVTRLEEEARSPEFDHGALDAPEPPPRASQSTAEYDVARELAAQPAPEPPASEPLPGEEAALEDEELEGEDVLEETPEFLQETPEHDRLWFEQKPPRDFDFDR